MKRSLQSIPVAFALLLTSGLAFAQQTHDFSTDSVTLPFSVRQNFPGTCKQGQVIVRSDQTAGSNVYLCGVSNDWNLLGGSVGSLYTADGTSLNLVGTQFSANTAVLASRVTAAQGVDTTCVIASGSSSAYVGAMRGNALTAYADGMLVRAEVDTTTAGSAITLNCGAGAKPVYQYDGVSNPTAAQWASGQQVLVTYGGALNAAAGGWRILSSSGSSAATPINMSYLFYGGMYAGTGTPLLLSANVTKFTEFTVPYPGLTISNITYYGKAGSDHLAFAIYDTSCNLLGTSATGVTSGGIANLTIPTTTIPAGKAYLAYTFDGTGSQVYNANLDGGYLTSMINQNESASTYRIFSGTASTGTTTLVFPSTCGTRTAINSGIVVPGVVLH